MTTPTAIPFRRLSTEKSVFLRSQASQPVDWYPWCEAAFQTAAREDKPVLLSIGYATSHWCHRMALDFSDSLVASVINQRFIAIKVDRDQRPDIDKAYQLALQALTQEGGGWPLTVFLTPKDRMPFFGGTYFSARPSDAMPGFADVLTRIADYYSESTETIQSQHTHLEQLLLAMSAPNPASLRVDEMPLHKARSELEKKFDGRYGGFSGAPKFPQPGLCERLLRAWVSSQHEPIPDLHALYMASLTMTRMGESGLNDIVRGGFFRHSTDIYWRIPCYEKTLSDNALLMALYAQAAIATGDPLYASTATATADWLMRDLWRTDGSFSAGEVGMPATSPDDSFVWTRGQIEACLRPDEYSAFALRFGLADAPTATDGRWHLHASRSLEEIAQALEIPRTEVSARIQSSLAALRKARAPALTVLRDDTVLIGPNALAIRGLAICARALGRPDYAVAASEAIDGLRRTVWAEGRLLLGQDRNGVGDDAFLDDYAYLLDATLELLATRWRTTDLDFAVSLAEALLSRFVDPRDGSLWFTAHDAERLIVRPKSFADDAAPSGNGVAARALNRLGFLVGNDHYCSAAQNILKAAATDLQQRPAAHGALLDALEEMGSPPERVVLRGPEDEIGHWHRELSRLYAPRRMLYAIPTGTEALPNSLSHLPEIQEPIAHVIRGDQALESFRTLPALIRHLRDGLELVED
jgi:uncharacterized protein